MNLVRYEPWTLLNQLHSEIDKLFDTRASGLASEGATVAASDWTPAVDIKEEPSRYVIHADVPGVDPKDIEVHMENGILSIKGERKSEKEEEREGYKRVERVRGTFFRRFNLPDIADADGIKATAKDGVLELTIPKQEKLQPRRIQIES